MNAENDLNIFRRSTLGEKELIDKSTGVLPREARNLLILLDGRKSYGQIAKSLEQRKMYQEAGGVGQYLELLLDLEYVELVLLNEKSSDAQARPRVPLPSEEVAQARDAVNSAVPKNDPPGFTEQQFSSKSFEQETESARSRSEDDSFEKLRSSIAGLIEKHTQEQESWGTLLKLESCKDRTDIYFLLKEIEDKNIGRLGKAVSKITKSLKPKGI